MGFGSTSVDVGFGSTSVDWPSLMRFCTDDPAGDGGTGRFVGAGTGRFVASPNAVMQSGLSGKPEGLAGIPGGCPTVPTAAARLATSALVAAAASLATSTLVAAGVGTTCMGIGSGTDDGSGSDQEWAGSSVPKLSWLLSVSIRSSAAASSRNSSVLSSSAEMASTRSSTSPYACMPPSGSGVAVVVGPGDPTPPLSRGVAGWPSKFINAS